MQTFVQIAHNLLTFQSRKCSACTAKGKRCLNYQCRASKYISLLPVKARSSLEAAIFKVTHLDRCNNTGNNDCCALCGSHMLMILAVLMTKYEAMSVFKQMNNIDDDDWKEWDHIGKTISNALDKMNV